MDGTATAACLLLDPVEVNYGKAVKSTRERERERGEGSSVWKINGGVNAERNVDTLTFEFAGSFYQRS